MARSRAGWLGLVVDLPMAAASVVVVGFIAYVVGPVPWGLLVIAAWLASGPLVLIRRVEDVVISGRQGLRRPTRAEHRQLAVAWGAVTAAAEVDPRRYTLWIEESARINAFAAAGHTVAVTSKAAMTLRGDHLEAVLAHELGHHMSGHTRAGLLRYWYCLPGSYALGFATYLSLAIIAALASGSVLTSLIVIAVVGGLLVAVATYAPILGVALLLVILLPFVVLRLNRAQEHQADLAAARLGYRDQLTELFIEEQLAGGVPPRFRWARLGVSHPPPDVRIRYIEQHLDT